MLYRVSELHRRRRHVWQQLRHQQVDDVHVANVDHRQATHVLKQRIVYGGRELHRRRQHVWEQVRHQEVDAVHVAIHVQCFHKGPQLMKWSAIRPHFTRKVAFPPNLMPDYIIEGNTQAAAQGNSWQDGVNALVMR